MIAAAAYHVYVKKVINEVKMSTMDMVLYNNTMSIPLLNIVVDDSASSRPGFLRYSSESARP